MALGCGLTACASAGAPAAAAPTTLTGADISASSVPASPTFEPASSDAPAPAGKLACRTRTSADGTTELFLDWNGKVATGVLRRSAPSGMVYEQPVRAERYQGTIVVDEPSSEDLASHAAMVVEQNGKLHMRVGAPGSPVSACE